MGGTVDRRYTAATEGDCTEPAGVDAGGGTDDVAGSTAMLTRFGVTLRVPLSALMHGRSISRKVTVHKVTSDVVEGAGMRSRLDGSYRIVLSPHRLIRGCKGFWGITEFGWRILRMGV